MKLSQLVPSEKIVEKINEGFYKAISVLEQVPESLRQFLLESLQTLEIPNKTEKIEEALIIQKELASVKKRLLEAKINPEKKVTALLLSLETFLEKRLEDYK